MKTCSKLSIYFDSDDPEEWHRKEMNAKLLSSSSDNIINNEWLKPHIQTIHYTHIEIEEVII